MTYPNANFDPSLGSALYARYLDELEYADQLGFDGIAVNEHHQSAYGLMPSPNLMAAALTRRTSRARIMVLGNAIAIRGNPLRVAEEIAMLDLMSGGRVDSGFVRGIGWEYFAHSINPVKSRSRFDEAHDLIIKAWTSPEMFSWYGANYEYRYVNIWPRPMQQSAPADLHTRGRVDRDDEVLRGTEIHVYVGIRADADRAALVRRLPCRRR